ncbi:MAG: DUF362 domain-containing protein, partial [Lentisphaeria bacterium]
MTPSSAPAELLFAEYAPVNLEPKNTIGAKWERLLDTLDLAAVVKGRRTAVKMHFGGGYGFSTIHPFFARKLVEKVKAAGAAEVFATDSAGAVREAATRGYTAETLGCQLVPVSGTADRYAYVRPLAAPFKKLKEIQVAGEIADAEALIDFSHVKAHGACGFGGAAKNLAMGCVIQQTKRDLHSLEGGLVWDEAACTRCRACLENCPNQAISLKNNKIEVFFHNCKYCQHCSLICPHQAIRIEGGGFRDFQQGMALATAAVLEPFRRENRALFINVLMDITVFCDCWGMTTPALVPDIGILAGRDIVAVEQASLDLIHTEDLIPGSLPKGWKLHPGNHLFERIHAKDPYAGVNALADCGLGRPEYVR